jgi:hypothetical protein
VYRVYNGPCPCAVEGEVPWHWCGEVSPTAVFRAYPRTLEMLSMLAFQCCQARYWDRLFVSAKYDNLSDYRNYRFKLVMLPGFNLFWHPVCGKARNNNDVVARQRALGGGGCRPS